MNRTASLVQRAAVAAVLAVASAGCGGANPVLSPLSLPAATTSTTTTTSVAPVAAPDYTQLLLQPSDVYVPGDGFTAPPPLRDPDGIEGAEELMTNGDQTRAVGITIVMESDAQTALREVPIARDKLSTVVPTAPPLSVPVGAGATAVVGVSPDGTKAVTALVFSQDRAIVRIDYYSALGQATPIDFVIEVGLKQAIALRVGLARQR